MLTISLLRRPVSCVTRSLVFKRFYQENRQVVKPTSVLNTNTNVIKDVILYKFENPRFYMLLNIFGLAQFGFWIYLANFAYTTLRDVPVPKENKENLAWWRRINLGEQKYKNTITVCCVLLGICFLSGSWTLTVRSVKYLTLRKGGKQIKLVTYGPFGREITMDVPIDKVSAAESRNVARVQLPLKIEGKWLYYMLDMRGQFFNKELFDATAGLNRKFAKR